ncbi:TolC family protein [Algibacter amylolyticus]|uniref:TolC family protein n=1 Tax=Algibacter amylolyticus TaxID=1608400 RepID=A0A5M7B9K6_9FLAO|nr:TolC family protein [Algibacter amylolyticus]KAA5826263.1 TolC family protein [Algibacter amylolyticus]MBB5268466.1 outer membrane protein TolC [Algibacter amylolyticus]TSJ80301.1 TolC family protein [Algibacter amylolyticus]
MNIKFVCFSLIVMLFHGSIIAQELITPEKAVSLALDNNYGIKLAKTDVEIAKNNADILNSGYLPTLTGNAGANYNLDDTEVGFADGTNRVLNGAESSRYNASVDLNYTIFDGLGRSYNYKQFKETKQLTELEARETIENTIVQLFTIYYKVAELVENKDAVSQTLNISKERLLRSQYQFEYGQSNKLASLNAEVDINNDSISLMNTIQELNNAKRDLNFVLGNTIPEDFNISTEVDFNNLYDKNELLNKVKDNNISVLQINKSIDINTLGVKSESSAYLPTVGLTGSYGWNKSNNNAASFAAYSVNTGLSGGLSLSWNLFDGGRTITNVRNAKLNLETQNIVKEQLLVSVVRDFNNAWDDYQNKLSVYKLQEHNIKTAQNNFDRTQEQFKLGQVNSIEFRQAQLNLLSAELSRNQAKYLAKLAEFQLLQISGEILNVEY